MKKLLASACAIVLVGAGCTLGNPDDGGPTLQYVSSGTSVTTQEVAARSVLPDTAALVAQSEECGASNDATYYDELLKKLDGETARVYTFQARGEVQEPDDWKVTVVPNVFGYTSINDLQGDFDLCAAGGQLYPMEVTDEFVSFQSSCGSGYSDDTDRPVGCEEAKKNTSINLR